MFALLTTRRLAGALVAVAWFAAAPSSAHAWAWPADGEVLRPFSVSDDRYAAGQHRGVDIAVVSAAAILAPAAGVVTFAGPVPSHGLAVTIETSDGYKASLTHVGALRVRRGAVVAEGDPVADVGPSGEPEHDVPYVHLGVRVGDERYVDPLGLLPPRSAPTPPPAPAAPPAPSPTAPEPSPPARRRPQLRRPRSRLPHHRRSRRPQRPPRRRPLRWRRAPPHPSRRRMCAVPLLRSRSPLRSARTVRPQLPLPTRGARGRKPSPRGLRRHVVSSRARTRSLLRHVRTGVRAVELAQRADSR